MWCASGGTTLKQPQRSVKAPCCRLDPTSAEFSVFFCSALFWVRAKLGEQGASSRTHPLVLPVGLWLNSFNCKSNRFQRSMEVIFGFGMGTLGGHHFGGNPRPPTTFVVVPTIERHSHIQSKGSSTKNQAVARTSEAQKRPSLRNGIVRCVGHHAGSYCVQHQVSKVPSQNHHKLGKSKGGNSHH